MQIMQNGLHMSTWEANVRRVKPYTPGEQLNVPGLIKLNTNENPFPPAPRVREEMLRMNADDFRKYPDPGCQILIKALASFYHLEPEQVFVGVGSDDVLSMAFLTFFSGEKEILFPDVTYSFYDVWAGLYRIPYRQIPLKEDFTLNVEDYYAPNGGIVIANPNAPTGICIGVDAIEDIVKHNPDSMVIVDEAYIDFGSKSALHLIDKYENVLIVQTFSKSRSMAGIRIGFAMGCKKAIKYLMDDKFAFNSYTMNMPSLTLGALAVEDADYFYKCNQKVVETRERMKPIFKELGFTGPDSMANFLFVRHDKMPRDEIAAKLRERKVLVRYFNDERIKDYLRISIGTDEEMDRLVEVLKEILPNK